MSTPNPNPTAAEVERARTDVKLANVLYHDWEATTYDAKWSISYDQRCIDYARDRFTAVAGNTGWPYAEALELGSGTGFFLLNLMQAGVAAKGYVTDLSPGMVEAAVRNGAALGLDVDGRVADAESIPYDDESVDLVVGHAVLHHIPDVELALREVLRVLKPGGRFVFAGEPTTVGDWYARHLGRLTWRAATTVTHLAPLRDRWARPEEELAESSRAAALESVVDIHTFDPRRAGGDRAARRCGRRAHRDRGADGRLPGLAGAHLRGRGEPAAARAGMGDVRLPLLAAALGRRPGARARPAAAAVLQRAAHRDPAGVSRQRPDPRQVPLRRFVSPESLRWVLRHRAYTPYYLVRYWRFLRLRLRHPQVVTEGFVFLGRDVEMHRPARLRPDRPRPLGAPRRPLLAARPRGHPADRRRRRCSAARTPSTATSTSSIGPRCIVADWVYVGDFDHRYDDLHVADQGPGHREVPGADRAPTCGWA